MDRYGNLLKPSVQWIWAGASREEEHAKNIEGIGGDHHDGEEKQKLEFIETFTPKTAPAENNQVYKTGHKREPNDIRHDGKRARRV